MDKQDKQSPLSHRKYRAYWKTVFCEASRLVWSNAWMKTAIISMGILVLGSLFLGILLSEKIIQTENPNQFVFTSSVFQIIEVGLYFLIVLFLFGSAIITIPPKKYYQKVAEINKRDNILKVAQDTKKVSRKSDLLKQIERDGIDEDDKIKWGAEIETLNPTLNERIKVAFIYFNIYVSEKNKIDALPEAQRESRIESIYHILESARRLDPDSSDYKKTEQRDYPNKVKK